MKSLQTTVLVIGSGISGLFTALKLSQAGVSVLLITKSSLHENNSKYAQGGIAAVMPESLDDSIDLHVQDTINAGAGLCDEQAVRSILTDAFPAILDLLAFGVPFDRTEANQLAFTKEAAHSRNRILHAGGDATGFSVEMALIEKVQQDSRIQVMEHCEVVDLRMVAGELAETKRCIGALAVDLPSREGLCIDAHYVVLATGGIGQVYGHTTNPLIATGDGFALADRAGAVLRDMEFFQFHPTAFYITPSCEQVDRVEFLISEALRGEGAILLNLRGEAFAKQYHPDGELAPRDILTRAIFEELKRDQAPYVLLDISHLPADRIEHRFPTILKNCLAFGVDIRKEAIPVRPAGHYMMGGVAVDLHGQSNIHGLLVVGETANTGLHGANRLASNSLLECVVLARRVAETIAAQLAERDRFSECTSSRLSSSEMALLPALSYTTLDSPDADITERLNALHQLMWENVGIVREGSALASALAQIEDWQKEAVLNQWAYCIPQGLEYVNQLQVAYRVTQAALVREESRGAHYRLDFPETSLAAAQSFETRPPVCVGV